MYAAANTPTCIRRGQSNQNLDGAQTTYCDPYGGFNSISTIPASSNDQNVIESLPQKSTVALVVRSDALSFFQSMATGTSHVGVSYVMQLAVARAINILLSDGTRAVFFGATNASTYTNKLFYYS